MSNQHTKHNLGLGEYSPRIQFRLNKLQRARFDLDLKATGLDMSRYVRCCCKLEAWPDEVLAVDAAPVKVARKRAKVSK